MPKAKLTAAKKDRINTFITPEANEMLDQLGQEWYPNILSNTKGAVIEKLIRDAYQLLTIQRQQSTE